MQAFWCDDFLAFIFYIAGLCAKYWVPRESQNYFVQSIGCQAKALSSLPLFPSLVLLLSQVRTAACAVKNKRQKQLSGHALDSQSALLESSKGGAVQHILLPSFSSRTCHAGKQKCSAGKSPGALSSTSCYLQSTALESSPRLAFIIIKSGEEWDVGVWCDA